MSRKLSINCSALTDDNLLSISEFYDYLKERIKVEGRRNNLTNNVNINVESDCVVLDCSIQFKKPYLKFLTKKFLHRKDLRDWVKLEGDGSDGYKMAFYDAAKNEE